MVLTTLVWVVVIKTNDPIRDFVQANIMLFYVALVGSIVIMISLICFKKVARRRPINMILLLAYTLFESYLVGAIVIYYSVESILVAMACTNALFFGLTLYAMFTKSDLTYMGGLLFGGSMILLSAIFLNFIIQIPILNTIIIVLILLLACVYVIYDTQLIVGKGKHALDMDEYVIGALLLYSDFITIFMSLLQLMGN